MWQIRNQPISFGKLEQYLREGDIQGDHQVVTTDEEAINHIHAASTVLRDCQRSHQELRESHLESLAEAIVLEQAPTLIYDSMAHIKEERVASQIQQLIQWEKIAEVLSQNRKHTLT